MKFKIAEDCIINEMFVDANDSLFERLRYCEENCCYRCFNGRDYKKRKEEAVSHDEI